MNVKKQNLTKEDFYFDTEGTGEKVNIFNSDGSVREATKLNASHIPILLALRSSLGDAPDVNSAIAYLINQINQAGGNASTSKAGIVELATGSEVIAGTSGTLAVSPLALKSLTALLTRAGLIQLATEVEALAGTNSSKAITPSTLKAVIDGVIKLEWSSTISYESDKIVSGGDGFFYVSQQAANFNNNPVGDDGTWWKEYNLNADNIVKTKVFGVISSAGAKLSGSDNWTVAKNSTGHYQLNITDAGDYMLICSLAEETVADTVIPTHSLTTGIFSNNTANNILTKRYGDSVSYNDSAWSFIAIKL